MTITNINLKSNMKKLLVLPFLFLASLLPAQLITITESNSGSFHDVVTLMNQSVRDLFIPESTGPYSSVIFTTDGFFDSAWIPNPTGTEPTFGFDILFKEIENPTSFVLESFANIGFIGNESMDRNSLSLIETDFLSNVIATDVLFQYQRPNRSTGTPAPFSYTLSVPQGEEAYFYFAHDNNKKGTNTQDDPMRFRIFQAFDMFTGEAQTQWLFAIDDRETNLIDFDDGFFFFSGEGTITPVPEPSVIAGLAFAGLISLLVIRRKITKNAKP